MTRNLYLGTAWDDVTAASNFAEFVQAVSQDWAHVGLFAVLGTDLGTEHRENHTNKCDAVNQAGQRNAVDLNV